MRRRESSPSGELAHMPSPPLRTAQDGDPLVGKAVAYKEREGGILAAGLRLLCFSWLPLRAGSCCTRGSVWALPLHRCAAATALCHKVSHQVEQQDEECRSKLELVAGGQRGGGLAPRLVHALGTLQLQRMGTTPSAAAAEQRSSRGTGKADGARAHHGSASGPEAPAVCSD